MFSSFAMVLYKKKIVFFGLCFYYTNYILYIYIIIYIYYFPILRLLEYSELEGTHKDVQVQLLSEWSSQGSNPQAWCTETCIS